MATATFQDNYSGAVSMTLKASTTRRNGVSSKVYTWDTVEAGRCVTTGFRGGFSSIERALSAANQHALFSNVVAA